MRVGNRLLHFGVDLVKLAECFHRHESFLLVVTLKPEVMSLLHKDCAGQLNLWPQFECWSCAL